MNGWSIIGLQASYGEEIPTGEDPNSWRLQIRDSSYGSVATIDYNHTAFLRTVDIAPDSPVEVLQGQTISLEAVSIPGNDFEGYTITLTLQNL